MLPIIVTVDTEGDNLWEACACQETSTNNVDYIIPFQNLCEKYKFFPVYLTNYEMAKCSKFIDFARKKIKEDLCEVGMHVHAWNSPPDFKFKKVRYSGNAYITEYPKDIIFEKHKQLKDIIKKNFGVCPVSYRAGRWATNDDLFDVLDELGFLVDCSVTPGIWHTSCGTTVRHANFYKNIVHKPYYLRKNLVEVPMSTTCNRSFYGNSLKRKLINLIRGEYLWLRPALQTEEQMKRLIKTCRQRGATHLMFMIHSSELMPNGSPYCKSEEDVSELLNKLENVFQYVSSFGKGYLLKDYYNIIGK